MLDRELVSGTVNEAGTEEASPWVSCAARGGGGRSVQHGRTGVAGGTSAMAGTQGTLEDK